MACSFPSTSIRTESAPPAASNPLALAFRCTSTPRCRSPFCTIRTASGSTPVRSAGNASTIVTFDPSFAYTVPSSIPMTPPPMTTRRPGTSGRSSASRAVQTSFPKANPGMAMGRAPVERMKAPASTRVFSPPASTSTAFGPTKVAVPLITSTPLPFSSEPTPPTSFFTTPSLKARSLATSTLGSETRMPRSAAPRISSTRLPTAMKALEGMHPQFRQTPPSESLSTSAVLLPSWASRMAAT